MARRVVLDTNYFRGASDDDLRAVRVRGFALRVSAIALAETWARAIRDTDPFILGRAAQRLRHHSRERIPVEEPLEMMVLRRGGILPPEAGDASLAAHEAGLEVAWEIATRSPLSLQDLHQGAFLVQAVDAGRTRWKSFCRRWIERQIEPGTREVLRTAPHTDLVEVLQAEIKEILSQGISDAGWRAGLDVFARVMASRAISGGTGQRTTGLNDAGDVQQLQHLVDEDVTFLTNDKRLRDSVRESGSPQSHRVLSLKELLERAP
jgi:hypothetical protein